MMIYLSDTVSIVGLTGLHVVRAQLNMFTTIIMLMGS